MLGKTFRALLSKDKIQIDHNPIFFCFTTGPLFSTLLADKGIFHYFEKGQLLADKGIT